MRIVKNATLLHGFDRNSALPTLLKPVSMSGRYLHCLLLVAFILSTTSCGFPKYVVQKPSKQQFISEDVAYRLLKSPLQGGYLCKENIRAEISFTDLHRTKNDILFKSHVRLYKSKDQLADDAVTGHFNLENGVMLLESKINYDSWPPPKVFTLVLGRDVAGKGWEGYVEDSRFETCYKAAFASQGSNPTSTLPIDIISPGDAFETAVQMNEIRYPWHLYLLDIAARNGDVNSRNYLTVISHFMKQAEQGDVSAFYKLGDLYSRGDYFEWKGGLHPWSQRDTTFAESYGIYKLPGYIQQPPQSNGLPKNSFFGANWYHKGAEHGSAVAQLELGIFYHQLKDPDDEQAAIWFRKAAEQGDAEGQFLLGFLYVFSKKLTHDYPQGAQWYHKAADQGFVRAQVDFGSLYEYGVGVPRDFAQAALWYRKASNQGDAKGQYLLGLLYTGGKGVPQDYAQAALWYRKAADQGHYEAAGALSNMYAKGLGVKQDSKQADYWYEKSITPAQKFNDIAEGVLNGMAEAAEKEEQYRRMQRELRNGSYY